MTQKPENVTCPECGGQMLSRVNRKTGQRFFGCATYPECRGTRNTDGESKPRQQPDDCEAQDELPSRVQSDRDRGRWRQPS